MWGGHPFFLAPTFNSKHTDKQPVYKMSDQHTQCNNPVIVDNASSNSTLIGSITDNEPQSLPQAAPSGIRSPTLTLTNNSQYRTGHSGSEASYGTSSAPSINATNQGHSDRGSRSHSTTGSAYSRQSHRPQFYTAYGPSGEVSRRVWPTSTGSEASSDGIRDQKLESHQQPRR